MGGLTLLYVGIAPTKRTKPSKGNLRKRIRYHFNGNAEGDTLRKSLGCLLADNLGIQLRRTGKSSITFAQGESKLSEWMDKNAFVVWTAHPKPWLLEEELTSRFSLPLNLQKNQRHPFHNTLSAMRKQAQKRAEELPIVMS